MHIISVHTQVLHVLKFPPQGSDSNSDETSNGVNASGVVAYLSPATPPELVSDNKGKFICY